MLTKRL